MYILSGNKSVNFFENSADLYFYNMKLVQMKTHQFTKVIKLVKDHKILLYIKIFECVKNVKMH